MRIKGIAVSPGKALSKALLLPAAEKSYLNKQTDGFNMHTEQKKFNEALEKLKTQYHATVARLLGEDKGEQAQILKMHEALMTDCLFVESVETRIKSGCCASEAVCLTTGELKKTFEALDSPFIRERISDIEDVAQQLVQILEGVIVSDLTGLNHEVVLFADDISPSLMVNLDGLYVKGIVTRKGSVTSHMGILAKSMGIPAVMGCNFDNIPDGTTAYLDGEKGIVELLDEDEEIEIYKELVLEELRQKQEWELYTGKLTVTKDSLKIKLFANLMDIKLANDVLKTGAEGIGLFRTEILYLGRNYPPSENEQFIIYKTLAEKLEGKPVIIRTMDIGGDKNACCIFMEPEPNPFLGCRGIRLSFEEIELFKIQLKAVLRASAYGNIQLMFPMISTVEELIYARQILYELMSGLDSQSVHYNRDMQVGIMVEVPSAVIMIDAMLKHADFVSIGSNDLAQYILAADRYNPKTASLYSYLNPAVLRMIKMTVDSTKCSGKPCGVCGEMASDPLAVPLLLGMGLEEFSVNTSVLLRTRKLICETGFNNAQKLAETVLSFESTQQVIDYLKGMRVLCL